MLVTDNSTGPVRRFVFRPSTGRRYVLGNWPARYLGQAATSAAAAAPLTPQQIVDSLVVNGAAIRGWNTTGDKYQKGLWNETLQAIQASRLPDSSLSSYCGKVPSTATSKIISLSASFASSAGQAASGGAAGTGSLFGLSIAGGPIAPILLGVAGALTIFGAIFSHHQQAVQKEQATECAAVPAANSSLAAIIAAVENGTITPQQGIASLQQLEADFTSAMDTIAHSNCQHPNAGCGWIAQMMGIVAWLSQQWATMPAASGPASGLLSSSSLPWLLAGGIGLLLLFSLGGEREP